MLMLSFVMTLLLNTFATWTHSDLASSDSMVMPGNALYVEAGGPGVLGSLNFERFLTERIYIRGGYALHSYDLLKGESTHGLLIGTSYRMPSADRRAANRTSAQGAIYIGPVVGTSIPSPSEWLAVGRESSTSYTVALHSAYSHPLTRGGIFLRLSLAPTYRFSPYGSGFVARAGLAVGTVF